MLADPRAEALATRFASQWLRLQDLDEITARRASCIPYCRQTLSAGAQARDRAVLREPRARGSQRARAAHGRLHVRQRADREALRHPQRHRHGVPARDGAGYRRGILGHGSVLTLTSVADRTSPVMRGKWVMEVLLGSPPPPPPPNVPALEETKAQPPARKLLTVRERMEQHRSNPACTSCHRVIDPLGLALENFDATGKWRIKDSGVAGRRGGQLYDGTPIDGPAGLRDAVLRHKDAFLLSFTQSLMTYALGPARRVRATCRRCAGSSATRRGRTTACQRVHPGRRRERRVPDEPSAAVSRATANHGGRDDVAARHVGISSPEQDSRTGERRPMFTSRATTCRAAPCCKGMGVTIGAAVPRCDGARRAPLAQTRRATVRLDRHGDGARLGRQHGLRHQEEHVGAGRCGQRLRSVADQPEAARALSRAT